jgi:uncharacterized protein YciW
MKHTKFDKLICIYDELGRQLGALNYPELEMILKSWTMSKSQIQSALNNPESNMRPSQFVSGLEQGLNETPLILSDLAEDKRVATLKLFYRVVKSNIPDFFKKIESSLANVVTLGKIKSENEWYIVRNRIDEIEGKESSREELSVLYNLIGAYESA